MKFITVKNRLYILMMLMSIFSFSAKAELEPGKPAPGFELYDQDSNRHKLEDYEGKWLVLYFYPKDDTPGCTIEACRFRDDIFRIRSLNAEILGISLDSIRSHAKFARDYGLPFPLLSDPGGKVADSYGSLMSLGPIKLARRNTIIIDPDGNIARIYRRVDPRHHSEEIIEDLEEMQNIKDD